MWARRSRSCWLPKAFGRSFMTSIPMRCNLIENGCLPFIEDSGKEMLQEVLPTKRLGFTSDPSRLRNVPNLILSIGTPIDEFHNPVRNVVTECMRNLFPYLEATRLIILRSTVSPGTTEELDRFLKQREAFLSNLVTDPRMFCSPSPYFQLTLTRASPWLARFQGFVHC